LIEHGLTLTVGPEWRKSKCLQTVSLTEQLVYDNMIITNDSFTYLRPEAYRE